jgi:hypothetical protein
MLHTRIVRARNGALEAKKPVPSFSELEFLFLSTRNCPGCGNTLDPHLSPKGNRKNIPTLQHWPDKFGVLCLPCNAKEGSSKDKNLFKIKE